MANEKETVSKKAAAADVLVWVDQVNLLSIVCLGCGLVVVFGGFVFPVLALAGGIGAIAAGGLFSRKSKAFAGYLRNKYGGV